MLRKCLLHGGTKLLFNPFALKCSRLLLPTPLTLLCKVLLDLLQFLFKRLLLCGKTLLFKCPLISCAARNKTHRNQDSATIAGSQIQPHG